MSVIWKSHPSSVLLSIVIFHLLLSPLSAFLSCMFVLFFLMASLLFFSLSPPPASLSLLPPPLLLYSPRLTLSPLHPPLPLSPLVSVILDPNTHRHIHVSHLLIFVFSFYSDYRLLRSQPFFFFSLHSKFLLNLHTSHHYFLFSSPSSDWV